MMVLMGRDSEREKDDDDGDMMIALVFCTEQRAHLLHLNSE
jgi:hypothetical protein